MSTTKQPKPSNGLSVLIAREQETAVDKFFKFFNLKKVSDITGIQPDKIYNNMREDYDSLTPADCKQIAEVLKPNVVKLFQKLGYKVTFSKA
jgi:hypothetical protein